jgi:hypothetical protein
VARRLAFAVSMVLVPALAAAGGVKPKVLADFESALAGPDGSEALVRAPSTATARRVAENGGQVLEFSGRQSPPGMAGVRITFLDAHGQASGVDASKYFYLTFLMRATAGASRIQIRIADSPARTEPLDAGELTRYLPEGLSADWRQVSVPLGLFGLNKNGLYSISFLVLDPTPFTLAVDDIALKRDPEDALPTPKRR